MLRRRLDPERHGSGGFTSTLRMAALGFAVGFFVLGTHIALQAWYDGRILPGVTVAGYNLGGMTLAQARAKVSDIGKNYRADLSIAGDRYVLTAPQMGVTYDIDETVTEAYQAGRDSWLPPMHQDGLALSYHLDRSQLNAFVNSVAAKVGTPPIDASINVTGTTLTTVAEKSGYTIDRVGLERLLQADVSSPGGVTMTVKPREQLADIQAVNLGPTIDEAKRLMATPIVLSYADQTYAPTAADIGQWLAFEKEPDGLAFKLVAQVDTSKLKSYVQTLANDIDVSPVIEKVTVENGVSHTEQQGQDGVAIDQDSLTTAIADSVTKQVPLTYTITSHSVPFKTVSNSLTSLDLGSYIEVNLTTQHLWVWQNNNVIFDSPITSGATGAGFPTVTGLFSIYYKTTNTHLVGYAYGPAYDYDVAVQYWMPFYEGFGLHDASWRNGNFGETSGPYGYYYDGSHGCINLPLATAEFLYNWSTVGTPVWVHN